jgi:hypothetical protein
MYLVEETNGTDRLTQNPEAMILSAYDLSCSKTLRVVCSHNKLSCPG